MRLILILLTGLLLTSCVTAHIPYNDVYYYEPKFYPPPPPRVVVIKPKVSNKEKPKDKPKQSDRNRNYKR